METIRICYNEFIMLFIDFLYFLILVFSFPLWIRYFFKHEYRSLLQARLRPKFRTIQHNPIWVHAVSVGEVKSLKSLIQSIQHELNLQVILSVTTPAGFFVARREYPNLEVIPAPLDFSFVVKRFLTQIQPRLILFHELELWPNWLKLGNQAGIPMLLINGRISTGAFQKYRLFSRFCVHFFNRLQCLIVQSEMYRERFRCLGVPEKRLVVCGNIKADEAMSAVEHLPSRLSMMQKLRIDPVDSRRIIVIASSHREDEELLIPALPQSEKNILFIWVPRHPERSAEIEQALLRRCISVELFSREKVIPPSIQVLIVDRIGFLFEIMSIADLVWIGGTCTPATGGHNLYEPAALGKPIAGGPHCENFLDIAQDLQHRGIYQVIHNAEEFAGLLGRFTELPLDEIRKSAFEEMEKRKGTLACTLQNIQCWLDS